MRAFAYGMLGVLLAVSLTQRGLSPVAIGALITVSLVGDFFGTYLIGLYADRWGRRRTLVALAGLMALTGAIFGLLSFYPILLIAGFFGTLGTSGSETAPFLPIEQAIVPQIVRSERRTATFARYNLVASFAGAMGALAAGLPDVLTHTGISLSSGIRLMFGLYVLAAFVAAVLAMRLSPSVEADSRPQATNGAQHRRWPPRFTPALHRSRSIVMRLAALFSVDALAGGLIVQSLVALYFHLRFGVPLGTLGVLFFAANSLSALSFLVAVPLARRFGLLNTMVFTHLPSNLLLAVVAFMPTFPLAAAVLLLRQLLSQMDVPTRQAYTMALVAPEERTAAASVTSLARSAGSAASPVISGALLQGMLLTLGLPFVIAGAMKSIYDLTLWRTFRQVRVIEEQPRGDPAAQRR
ncbi:MAG TPA: MFS transporter [Solirubrobacteraceae bacterium]|nr:MFS transporter [Solirubrobacteraceae bacterium]